MYHTRSVMFSTSVRVVAASLSASLKMRPSISATMSWPAWQGHGFASMGDSQLIEGKALLTCTPVGTIESVGNAPFENGATCLGPPKPLTPSAWARKEIADVVGKSDGTVAGGLMPAHHFTARHSVSWNAAQR